jgi:hypothetical protein
MGGSARAYGVRNFPSQDVCRQLVPIHRGIGAKSMNGILSDDRLLIEEVMRLGEE